MDDNSITCATTAMIQLKTILFAFGITYKYETLTAEIDFTIAWFRRKYVHGA